MRVRETQYISNILDNLKDAKYLTTLDIRLTYWQIPIADELVQYIAFTILNHSLFQFRRIVFVLRNATATFQHFIDKVLGYDLEPYVFLYLDDIIVVSSTLDIYLKILIELFRRIKSAGLPSIEKHAIFVNKSYVILVIL